MFRVAARFRFALTAVVLVVVSTQIQAELRDPTRPYGYNPTVAQDAGDDSGVVLDGIIKGPQGLSAVISGKRVYVNDDFNGKTVTAIKRDRVVLDVNGISKTLFLSSKSFKKRVVKSNSEQTGGQ